MKIATVFGTRPEAIKMAPVILELRHPPKIFEVVTIVSGQHRQMLDDPLEIFGIKPDYDLKIMKPHQSLFDISRRILGKIEAILKKEKPNLVLVQGDTPTTFTGALAAFYLKIPVGHIEAGLRTYQKYSPFPEEVNRQLIDVMTDLFFVHTEDAKQNLLREGKPEEMIWVTGNTDIDAVSLIAKNLNNFILKTLEKIDFEGKKIIFLECHRRESWGVKLEEIFKGVAKVVSEFDDLEVIFPVHLNPIVQKSARKILGKYSKIHLLPPLNYSDMVQVAKKCYLVATDSGGLQEETPVFDKPVLVLRDVTERIEGIKAGTLKLAGTTKESVYQSLKELISDRKLYQKMAEARNPYGDGKAAQRIRQAIIKYFNLS